MKHKFFYSFLSLCMCSAIACSNDDKFPEDFPEAEPSDYVEVAFNLTGDFLNVTDTPLGRYVIENPKTYYFIRIIDTQDYPLMGRWTIPGYVGMFDDIKYARIRLERNKTYEINATALIENEDKINPDDLSYIYYAPPRGYGGSKDTTNIHNKFSQYKKIGDGDGYYSGAIRSPEYEDASVNRYYNCETKTITGNETVSIELQRYSYKLQFEIDPPASGHIVLSCDHPSFSYKVGTNDAHLSASKIFALGKFDLKEASKAIPVKLEHFNAEGVSDKISTQEITVKPNVETTIRVNYNDIEANNSFDLKLDQTPMIKEEYIWK